MHIWTNKQKAIKRIANEISLLNWLSKNAINSKSKSVAYKLKSQKLSIALIKYGESFPLIKVETHKNLGSLLLIDLPNKYQAHVPFNRLSQEAQTQILCSINSLNMQQTSLISLAVCA